MKVTQRKRKLEIFLRKQQPHCCITARCLDPKPWTLHLGSSLQLLIVNLVKSYEENGMCIRRGEIEHNSLCHRRRHNSGSGWSYTYSWALGGGGEEFFIATICCCCESVILLHSGFLSNVHLLGISIMKFIMKSTGFSCRMFFLDFILMAVQIHVLSHMSCLHPPLVSVL